MSHFEYGVPALFQNLNRIITTPRMYFDHYMPNPPFHQQSQRTSQNGPFGTLYIYLQKLNLPDVKSIAYGIKRRGNDFDLWPRGVRTPCYGVRLLQVWLCQDCF